MFRFFFRTWSKLILDLSGHSWYDIGKDYCLPIGLGLLGVVAAYFIFYKETKRDRDKEKADKLQERNDKMLFLASLVKNIIRVSESQIKNILEYAEKIKQKSEKFYLMAIVPLHDFRRFTTVIDIEKYMLSYTEFYNKNRKVSVEEFRNMISATDFLYDYFSSLPDQLNKERRYYLERANKIKALNEEANSISGDFFADETLLPTSQYNLLKQIYEAFTKEIEDKNEEIMIHNDFFFVPLNNFCKECFNAGLPVTPKFKRLAEITNEAIGLYKYLKKEQLKHADEYIKDLNQLESAKKKLKDVQLLIDF